MNNPIDYFQNEQGDYTITIHEQPFSFVKEENEAKKLKASFQMICTELRDTAKAFEELSNKYHDAVRRLEGSKKLFEDQAKRHSSQLLSVYYMLGAVSSTGTHRQKESVIIFMRKVLEDLINSHDPLPLSDEVMRDHPYFGLPF